MQPEPLSDRPAFRMKRKSGHAGWFLPIIAITMMAISTTALGRTVSGWQPWLLSRSMFASGQVNRAGPRGDDAVRVASRLAPKVARLARDGSPALQVARLQGKSAPARLQAVVLMCDFADSLLYGRRIDGVPESAQTEFYYAAHDSLYFHQLLGDVATYFDAVSDGRFSLEYTVCGRVARLSRPMAFYGNDPLIGEQPVLLAVEAIDSLDAFVDFSLYDTVILIHAGAGEETDIADNSPEQIFSTYLGPEDFQAAAVESLIATPYITTDDFPEGEGVRQVLILPETEYQDPLGGFGGFFGSLGVYCFEVGLRLGMLSLSDFTPPGRPDSQGIGEFGLMGYGLFVGAGYVPDHPCAFNKMLMGWLDPYPVSPYEDGTYRLAPAENASSSLAAARVDISDREYWLLEFRLQDPDGNGIFSWDNDLNGDGVPNFTAIDDSSFVPVPFVDFFDPELHVREQLTGGEFDFFMSENPARPPAVKGAGSGVYIWHIDEGVILDSFDASGNVFNADPQRKSVDLEEADGIQDLDSRLGSPYILGGDDDSYRGEGSSSYGADYVVGTVFGPDTDPGTETAGGGWTGVVIDQFSNVVRDSTFIVDSGTIIQYADTMSFRYHRANASVTGPRLAARVEFPGIDLRGSHLLAVDLDVGGDEDGWEIVVVGHRGEIYALNPDLTSQVERDGDPSTLDLLAVGTDPEGQPVVWNGPPAAGELSGDLGAEIVLSAPAGLYAFHGSDGGELLDGDGDPDSFGLLCPLSGCHLPPVLLPAESPGIYGAGTGVIACVIEIVDDESAVRFIDGNGNDALPALNLGRVVVTVPPQLVGSWLAVVTSDTSAARHSLAVWEWNDGGPLASPLFTVPLDIEPASWPLAGEPYATLLGGALKPWACVTVVGRNGGAETLWWSESSFQQRDLWPVREGPFSPLAPFAYMAPEAALSASPQPPESPRASAGLAYLEDASFALRTASGVSLRGWPVRPDPVAQFPTPETSPSPLRTEFADGTRAVLFGSRDGRLYLYDEEGRLLPGWPASGPADIAGTPLLLDLQFDGRLDLVSVGSFERIIGVDPDDDRLLTETVSSLAIWTDFADSQPFSAGVIGWPMWQGTPWRVLGRWNILRPRDGGGLLAAGSHVCYPNPLTDGPLYVRGLSSASVAVRVTVLNLEGEEVAASGPRRFPAGEPFEVQLPLDEAASGLYLCRLRVQAADGVSEISVVPFAVAR
jgi:hypothetical protein